MRAWWVHISDPVLWPIERLFLELYGQALQGRAHMTEVLDGIVDAWLDPIAQISIDLGRFTRHRPSPRAARDRDHARAPLDLLATADVSGVDAAMDAFIDIVDAWLQRAAA